MTTKINDRELLSSLYTTELYEGWCVDEGTVTEIATGAVLHVCIHTEEQVRRCVKLDCKCFLERLFLRLEKSDIPCVWGKNKKAIFYRHGDGTVGNIQVHSYCEPQLGMYRPLVYRWHVDDYMAEISDASLERLGADAAGRSAFGRESHQFDIKRKLELSFLFPQCEILCAWLPTWILERNEGRVAEPPVPFDAPPVDYVWTSDASREYTAYERFRKMIELRRLVERIGQRTGGDA